MPAIECRSNNNPGASLTIQLIAREPVLYKQRWLRYIACSLRGAEIGTDTSGTGINRVFRYGMAAQRNANAVGLEDRGDGTVPAAYMCRGAAQNTSAEGNHGRFQ